MGHTSITTGSSLSTNMLLKTGQYHELLNAKRTCTLASETRNNASKDNNHLL
jgi:hypothetical protein